MNILWISHEYPPIGGGGATACRALAREFAASGHNVTVISAAFEDTPALETIDGVSIHRLKCRRSAKDQSSFFEMLSFLAAAFRYVPKLVKAGSFDIAFISFGIPSGPLGWYLKKRHGLRYIVRSGGGDIPGTQKRFKAVYTLLGPAIKAVWRNAEYIVANSRGLRTRAEKYYSKANFRVICNGIDLKEFGGAESGKWKVESGKPDTKGVEEVFQIITTARIVERKGIQHVIEALPDIVRETGGHIRYTVVGDGPYRKEIEALAARLDVGKYIEITGMIPFKDVRKRLREADVFVLASHWEGMPNSVIEAMASHLPVIMSNCEGSAELVDGNGYIINSESIVSGLTEKILILYNDRKTLAQMGEKSFERVCKHFVWEKSAAEYLGLMG